MSKSGVLLINLGTPDACTPKAVRRYLREFLNDPRVVDLPAPIRWLLVNRIIIPTRYKTTTAAYQKIWCDAGSPLLMHSNALKQALQKKMGEEYQVELGMRYGNPSIAKALYELRHCKRIQIIPLFPQYSSAATGSVIEKTLQYLSQQWNIPQISIVRDFYNHPGFINAYVDRINQHLQQPVDLVLFSYHGLPQRHITKSHCKVPCQFQHCARVNDDSQFCYRAQCYETSWSLAKALNLKPEQYQTAFQSRLGKTEWIKPYTDLLLPELIQKGVRNIAIVCPSFVADCLETLEEIHIRAREQWKQLGGANFHCIPCINDHPLWVDALAQMISA